MTLSPDDYLHLSDSLPIKLWLLGNCKQIGITVHVLVSSGKAASDIECMTSWGKHLVLV